ncbi:hypothetical protein GCM10009785_09150 [Brooklawnia cerclae]
MLISLTAGVICWLVHLAFWLDGTKFKPGLPGWLPFAKAVSLASAAFVMSILSALTGFTILVAMDSYTILSPASDGGCRVVVSEGIGTMPGYAGKVFVASSGPTILHDTGGRWSTGELAYDPFEEGAWTLAWNGPTADLNMSSAEGHVDNRVIYGAQPILCPD